MPAAASTQALLLRSVSYGESDQVVSLATRAFGKISCLAKHSKGSQRRFGAALQPFCKFEALLRPKGGGALSFLESAMPLKGWPRLLDSLERLGGGFRLLELADLLQEQGAAHAEFFDALEGGLDRLAAAPEVDEAVLRCEAALLGLAGWSPRLDACVSCRREAPFPSPKLSLSEGGLLCASCKAEGAWLALKGGAGLALQRLFSGSEGGVAEARLPLRRFVEYQLGRALKTEAFELSLKGKG